MNLIKIKCRKLNDKDEINSFLAAAKLIPGVVFAYVDEYLRPCCFVEADSPDEAIRGQEPVYGRSFKVFEESNENSS